MSMLSLAKCFLAGSFTCAAGLRLYMDLIGKEVFAEVLR
jgi:hypothetical protein